MATNQPSPDYPWRPPFSCAVCHQEIQAGEYCAEHQSSAFSRSITPESDERPPSHTHVQTDETTIHEPPTTQLRGLGISGSTSPQTVVELGFEGPGAVGEHGEAHAEEEHLPAAGVAGGWRGAPDEGVLGVDEGVVEGSPSDDSYPHRYFNAPATAPDFHHRRPPLPTRPPPYTFEDHQQHQLQNQQETDEMNGNAGGGPGGPGPRPSGSVGPGGASPASMGGGGGGPGMNAGFPTAAGHQMDLNHLWGLVQELSAQLKENRESTQLIVSRVTELRRRAAAGEGGMSELLRAVNGDEQSRNIADLHARIDEITARNGSLDHECTELSSLVYNYEAAIAKVLEMVRSYTSQQNTTMNEWHRYYMNQLARERQEKIDLQNQQFETQAGIRRVMGIMREGLRQSDEELSLISENAGLRRQVKSLRRLLDWPVEDSDDEQGEGEGTGEGLGEGEGEASN